MKSTRRSALWVVMWMISAELENLENVNRHINWGSKSRVQEQIDLNLRWLELFRCTYEEGEELAGRAAGVTAECVGAKIRPKFHTLLRKEVSQVKVPMQSNKCENRKLWCRWTAWWPMTRTMTVSTNSKPKETFGLVRQVQLSFKSCVFSTRHVKCLMIMFHAAIQQLSPMARETKCPRLDTRCVTFFSATWCN